MLKGLDQTSGKSSDLVSLTLGGKGPRGPCIYAEYHAPRR